MSTPAAVRTWEAHFTVFLTVWRSIILGSFVQPLLYLLGMGLGVGALIDQGSSSDELLDGLTYFQYLGPAIIATSAMMVTTNEAMWPVVGGFKWWRGFHAAAATPVTPGQIAGGVALWHLTKSFIVATGVAGVLMVFPDTRGWGLFVAIVFGTLTGVAFSAPMMAWSATRENDNSFPVINRFLIVPLFLFAGAFYPVSQLPDWLEAFAVITPLWHGVQLCRDAAYGRLELVPTIVHVAYLVALTATGWVLATRSFRRRLGE
jgi:lipooligosaccharide transport system permease protein